VELASRLGANRIGGLQILWEDGELAFCRGRRDSAEGARYGVLVVLPISEQPTRATLDRLAHEYSLKDALDGALAVLPLELLRERGRPLLVLEDPGGEVLSSLLGAPMELGRFLRVAVGVAAALGKAHQHGLIHKDIKPANILVNTASGAVRLTGFGIASRLPRERQPPDPPEFIAGTLAYMAPEQTGRMNHSVDSRSDLYSLGVTLYEMLTGVLPFTASDPMEWVYCHIARKPAPPNARLDSIPTPVSSIVMKLLAKTAEERYQTAAGVERDLLRCLADWVRGTVADFPLGEDDATDRLLIPEKLYGREREVETLLASFDRVVKSGAPELALVSGYSGIGKSSVVNELHKVLVSPRGLFASGKFDQHKRDIPYATVAQAFQSLVRQILSKSEAELQAWRDALREALGPNGLLIVNLIPELELVIGKQSPVHDLSPQDAQRRYQMTLRRFIGVFARPEHPLALFLDDLQWVDAATLDLLEDLLAQGHIGHLLLIGAYRDNEVDAAHPLMRKLDAIRAAGATVHDIVLAPLRYDDLAQLIADSLRCEPRRARPLAQLVQEKTGGNPFFASQFLFALADEALLSFDHADARWSWELRRIHAKRYTDNVVDLMVIKLNRLPAEALAVLRQLACVGFGAEFALLATVCQTSQEELHKSLWEAVRSGLVLRSEDAYTFQHDRIQEAAYSLIPEGSRAEAHLRIGRLLLKHTPPDKREETIFEIVSQFNRNPSLITSRDEREQLSQLNLIAGKRAKDAAAYSSALTYLAEGRALLAEDCWTRQYQCAFELEFHRSECEFLTGGIANAEKRLSTLATRAETLVDQAAVASLRVDLYEMLARMDRAIAVCFEYLRQVGFEISPHPTDEEVRQEYEQLWRRLAARPIEDLVDLPLMEDENRRATIGVLYKLMVCATYEDQKLYHLLIARVVNLSLEYGNSNASCFSYVSLGSILAADFGEYATALRFAQLGLALVETRGLDAFKARIYLRFGIGISPLTHHFRFGRTFILRARDEADKIGDVLYSGHCRAHVIKNLIASGEPLTEVEQEAVNGLAFARKIGSSYIFVTILNKLHQTRSLRGLPLDLRLFDGTEVDEGEYERRLDADSNLAFPACAYWTRKLQTCVFLGNYASALDAAIKAQGMLLGPSFVERAEYHFYAGLARAGLVDTTGGAQSDQTAHLEALRAHHRHLQIWTEHCPENFENRAALVGAELARLEGRDRDAERLYEQAIRSARANSFVHNEALACETAARFYAARGLEDIAEMYLAKARESYFRWGADGKVRQLEARHPQLVVADPSGGAATSPEQQLDVAAVVKASQALSSEMLLPRLIEQLMTIAMQNAGADRGLLILSQRDDYRIEAEARADGERIVLHDVASAGSAAPESIVRYVMRSRECVILDDATKQNLFSEDPYLTLRQPRSVLCLPLIRQGALVGLLYLENALASHVFTPDRARLLEHLAAQAAISLENTRLYGDLQERESKVRRLVDSNIIGICIFDFDGRLMEANDAFLDIVGYSRDDLISSPLRWRGLTPPEWSAADDRALAEVAATGACKPYEKEFFRKDGSRAPVLMAGANFDELRRQGVAFALDLTERKRAEAELAHANRVATMGQLAASIAHEVNQPLAALLTNAATAARWLDRQPPSLEKSRTLIDRIIGDGRRASDIVSRIRDFSKKEPARTTSLELNDAILEILGLTHVEMSKHDVSLKTQLSEGLPPVLGDRVQLQQVILNLILNAVEAMSDVADGPREVLISTATDKDGVLVAVRDSGPGLPRANPERVFEAFYTTKTSGLGMGLAICRSIVVAHGGRLWAAPNEPRGAAFYVMLPAGKRSLENLQSSGS
jgi:PAS domain S-box-containing protein